MVDRPVVCILLVLVLGLCLAPAVQAQAGCGPYGSYGYPPNYSPYGSPTHVPYGYSGYAPYAYSGYSPYAYNGYGYDPYYHERRRNRRARNIAIGIGAALLIGSLLRR